MKRKLSSMLLAFSSIIFVSILIAPVVDVKSFTTKAEVTDSYENSLEYIYLISDKDYDYLMENKGDIDANKVKIKSFLVQFTNTEKKEFNGIKDLYGEDSITLADLNTNFKDPNATLYKYNERHIVVKKSILGIKTKAEKSSETNYSVKLKSPHMKLSPEDSPIIKLKSENRDQVLVFDREDEANKEGNE